MSNITPTGQHDQPLTIDRTEFYYHLDYVREGLKRMLSNYEFSHREAQVIATIAFLDEEAQLRAASLNEARRLFPTGERKGHYETRFIDDTTP